MVAGGTSSSARHFPEDDLPMGKRNQPDQLCLGLAHSGAGEESMTDKEIRIRCIEAAAHAYRHEDYQYGAGMLASQRVISMAKEFITFVYAESIHSEELGMSVEIVDKEP